MDRSRIALVIPALNEGATIASVVSAVGKYGRVIVVDDGSTDRTAEHARGAGADVVVRSRNGGYDAALEAGFARASALGCDYVITLDADGQHPSDNIPPFVDALVGGAALVVGVRDQSARMSERFFQMFSRTLFDIEDPLCGMKGYRIGLYRALGRFDSYRSIGTELMLFAVGQKVRVAQIRVHTRPRVGQARMGGRLRANYLIFRAAIVGLTKYFLRSLRPINQAETSGM